MSIVDLAVLALAVFTLWEIIKPLLPNNLPDVVVALGMGVVVYAVHRWVPMEYVELLAVVAALGVLHQKFGRSSVGTHAIRLPRGRRSTVTLPR